MKSYQITSIDLTALHELDTVDETFENPLIDLKNQLNEVKSQLDEIYKNHWSKTIMKCFDPFLTEKHGIARDNNIYNITNAWLKGYEIIEHFQLIPTSSNKFIYFDNASFPGSFIIAVNHYVRTQTDIKNFKWYGSSLIDKNNLGDDFALMKNYPKNWLMNIKNNGDITKLLNILDFQTQLNDCYGNRERTVNLYSCDLGLDWGSYYNNQESISFDANLCQILCGLLTLKSDGHMFVKHFTLFESFTLSYLSLLTGLFKEVYITKPLSSKRTNSELYIVCKYYKYPFVNNSMESNIIDLFINYLLKNGKEERVPFISSKYIEPQINSIKTACENIYKTQMTTLKKFIFSVQNIKNPSVNENCYKLLQKENQKIIDEYKKINIRPIHNLHQLCMFEKY